MKGIKKFLENQEEVSKAIIKLIEHTERKSTRNDHREIKLVSVHGHRNRKPLHANILPKHFVGCINKNWLFYEVTGIYSNERLKTKIEQCKLVEGAQRYILKAYVNVNGLTILNPLIIGKEDVILGIDDPVIDTVSKALHIKGEENVQFFTSYFEELWKAPDSLLLRDSSGIHDSVANKIREMLC